MKRPSVLLTDLEMPNLNGLALTRRVHQVQQWMAMPTVMMTPRAGDRRRQIAAEAGVDVYLTKPYLDADLLALVKRLYAADANTLEV